MANFYFVTHLDGGMATIEEDYHHIVRVARHRPGERIGILYPPYRGSGRIKAIGKDRIEVEVEELVEVKPSGRRLAVAIPVIKESPLREILVHSTELGVSRILIFQSRFSRKLTWLRADKIERILREAAKQCGNPFLPRVDFLTFEEISGNGVFMDPDGERFDSYRPVEGENLVVVGPEGGLAEEEKTLLISRGFASVSFDIFTLRTETAALVGITLAKFLWNIGYEEVPVLRI